MISSTGAAVPEGWTAAEGVLVLSMVIEASPECRSFASLLNAHQPESKTEQNDRDLAASVPLPAGIPGLPVESAAPTRRPRNVPRAGEMPKCSSCKLKEGQYLVPFGIGETQFKQEAPRAVVTSEHKAADTCVSNW
jgi:hypothetical protein